MDPTSATIRILNPPSASFLLAFVITHRNIFAHEFAVMKKISIIERNKKEIPKQIEESL